jgi:hypothetical protein
MAYITYLDIEEFLNITLQASGQALVADIIKAVEAASERYCNRKWDVETEQIEKFDGGTDIFLPQIVPIKEIKSVVVNGSDVAADLIYNYGSYIRLDFKAINLPQTVVVTYTPDCSLPEDVGHAMIRWVSDIFKSQEDAGKSVSRVSVGPMSIDYLVKDGMPAFVQMVLDQNRLGAV